MATGLSGWKENIVAFGGAHLQMKAVAVSNPVWMVTRRARIAMSAKGVPEAVLKKIDSLNKPASQDAFLAMLGSVLGCVLLFYLAEKSGEALFHRQAGKRAQAIHNWVVKNGFGGMLIAALLPPPTPFKIFVVAAGVFEVPVVSFASAITLARAIRYFGIGYLAIRYGHQALPFLKQHIWQVSLAVILAALLSYALSRAVLKHRPPAES